MTSPENAGQQIAPYVRPSAEEQVENLKKLKRDSGDALPIYRGGQVGEARGMVRLPKEYPVGGNQEDDLEVDMRPKVNMYGQGTYFSTSPHLAGLFAAQHGTPAITVAHHTDTSPLYIPTGTREEPFIAHPDQRVVGQALDTFDKLYPKIKRIEEERLPTTLATRRASIFGSGDELAHERDTQESDADFHDRVIGERLQGWHDLRSRLESGDSREIARLGRRMGYQSTMVAVHRPSENIPESNREQAEVVAHTPSSVRILGAQEIPDIAASIGQGPMGATVTHGASNPQAFRNRIDQFLKGTQKSFSIKPE